MSVRSKPKAKPTLTRREREAANAAAEAEFDAIDWAPIGRGTLVFLIVLVLLFAAWLFVPAGSKFGGPLQDSNVAAGSTMSTVRRAGNGVVTVGAFVPWNTSGSPALLEQVIPVGAEGVEVVKTGLVAPGQFSIDPQRGYPPDGLILFPVEGSTIDPGTGTLDGAQIAIGLRGEGSVLGFILVYRVGGERQAALLPNGAVLCRRACADTTALAQHQRDYFGRLSAYVDAPSR
jgi:hypothetical protein